MREAYEAHSARKGNQRMNNTEMTAATTETPAAVAQQAATAAPKKAASKKAASEKKGAPKAARKAPKAPSSEAGPKRGAAPKKAAKAAAKKVTNAKRKATAATAPHEGKGTMIVAMISRTKGATLAELRQAAEWQAHSVRGFLSTYAKKHSIKIDSRKNETGERVYQISE
jgi:hypothetical protein